MTFDQCPYPPFRSCVRTFVANDRSSGSLVARAMSPERMSSTYVLSTTRIATSPRSAAPCEGPAPAGLPRECGGGGGCRWATRPATAPSRSIPNCAPSCWTCGFPFIGSGGSVGFAPPAPVEAVGRTLARVAAGTDALGVLRTTGTVAGMGLLVDAGSPLRRHWRTVLRVMVRPQHQGRGNGAALMPACTPTAGCSVWSSRR